MDFSANKQDTYEKRIASLPDQPNMQPDELKAYFDSSPEQLRQAHNGLCDALTEATSSTSAAAGLGFQRTAGVPADNVQAAVENVQAQLDAAVMGNIPSGSVTQDKLAQDVRDRFAAIESAAASEASTRASGDSNLQNQIDTHTTQIASKCEIVYGNYTGDGAATHDIVLGFAPKAVLVCGNNRFNTSSSAFALQGETVKSNTFLLLSVHSTGFSCGYGSDYPYEALTNMKNAKYQYIAFK